MTTWPATLWIVRHGESAGNVARDAAHASGADRIELSARDVDIPLSQLGKEQASALGRWFAAQRPSERPELILSSPYVRAHDTARHIAAAIGDLPIRIDERLREKEFGILDGLTTQGVAALQPDQAEFRRLLGKFYHRPPGGESWCDVVFRLRSILDTIALHHGGRRVLIVAHQVVVLCLRYVIEELSEAEILAIDREGDVANCSVIQYRTEEDGNPRLIGYNVTAALSGEATVTTETAEPKGVRG